MDSLTDDVLFLVVALLLAYGIYTTLGAALATDTPMVAVTTGSMEPVLERGDMIVVRGVPFDDLQVGDIIVYETGRTPVPVIHRVVAKNATALQTKGDALDRQHDFEKHVTPDQIHGRAEITLPLVGYVKLLPTCAFYRLQGIPQSQLTFVCPTGQL